MKRALVMILLAALLAASGCAGAEGAKLTENSPLEEKFWDIDIGLTEYKKTIVSHNYSWQRDGVLVTLSIYPVGYGNKDPWPDTQMITENGREFIVSDYDMEVDPVDGPGFTSRVREMRWSDGSREYLLYSQTGYDNDLSEIVSVKTAGQIEANDYSAFAGMEPGEGYLMRLNSKDKEINLRVVPPPYDKEYMRSIVAGGVMVFHEDDGFEYYLYEKERTPQDINAGSILWNTDKGLIIFSARISYVQSNEVPGEEWDFVNTDLARSITGQLGAKIVPLPEA